ncbi:MAG: phenylalanine--tRNA ligase subunit alpha [Solitalea-like symbiont of Tyrophagus putrescentiae]
MKLDKLSEYIDSIKNTTIKSLSELEDFKLKILSKKGLISNLFSDFKQYNEENKKEIGKKINELKQLAEATFKQYQEKVQAQVLKSNHDNYFDASLPGQDVFIASRHPISIVQNQIINIFKNLGFTLEYGPEVEDDYHNFTALNFPLNHPARDMQDTFFIKNDSDEKLLLRTHTSSVQIRLMESNNPPFRAIMPGRVYRNETISARSHCFFHQVEGLAVDEKISFVDLKQTLKIFIEDFFNGYENVKTRFRPSFFPFTEPSAEVDISCLVCKGKGCNICKYSGWLEILGCGLVHPNVLANCSIEPKYSGFAFGMGIERLAMLKYGYVNDLRMFYENDLDFLTSFKSHII